MRHKHYLRNAVTLGTSLTALFLLVRCTVDERDYSRLGIGDDAGAGGGGSGGDGVGGTSAGQGGLGGMAGMGGQAGMPVEPIPCDSSIDAGINDAGADAGNDAGSDAGGPDAGNGAARCACVDGFIQAVDADGDGEGTRECAVAPGLDCDDGDGAVTHNGCGGCTALPNEIGADCLDCGAYVCDGPDALACASKPNPTVVDPDCQCRDGVIAARDTDEDGQGTRLCEENPGTDCNDGDETFVTNQCGGCDTLPGTVGGDCNQCGAYACSGTALVCAPKTGTAGRRCLDGNTRQTCIGTGFWGGDTDCANVCYQGSCEVCTPGTYRCVPYSGSTQLERCGTNFSSSSSTGTIGWGSYDSCYSGGCDANAGQCTGFLLLPRDRTFDVLPAPNRRGLPWHDVLNTASDADYG